jgi:hypothetical protein
VKSEPSEDVPRGLGRPADLVAIAHAAGWAEADLHLALRVRPTSPRRMCLALNAFVARAQYGDAEAKAKLDALLVCPAAISRSTGVCQRAGLNFSCWIVIAMREKNQRQSRFS